MTLTAVFAPWSSLMALFCEIGAAVYLVADLSIAGSVAIKKGVRCGLWSTIVFPILHISYGVGYLRGVLDFLILRKQEASDPFALQLSR